MKTTVVSSNSLQLTQYGFVNCYLVREDDGFTLIDAGMAGAQKGILAAAASANLTIRRILLTHAHQDHVGSIDALVSSLGSIELAASERSVPLLRHPPDKSLQPGEPNGPIKSIPGIQTPVTRIVAEGDLYGSLRVIDTPGHLPGHQSFLDERDGTLFAGDAVVGVGGLTIAGYGSGFASLMNGFTWDKTLALASARKLTGYKIARFATGHMAVREGGVQVLKAVLAKVKA